MLDVRSVAAGTANAMGQPGFALVSAVDPVNHAVKVVTQPSGIESGWLPYAALQVGSLRISCPPDVGAHVVLQHIDGDAEHGVVACPIYDAVVMPPLSPATGKVAQPGVEEFFRDHPGYSRKTISAYNTTMKQVLAVIGRKPMRDMTKADVKRYADHLRDTPGRDGQVRKTKTIERQMSEIRTFMAWAVSCGYVADRGFADVKGRGRTLEEKQLRQEDIRRAFTSDELKRFFNTPLFVGSKSSTMRASPGNYRHRDHDFWFMMIMALTGARDAEIAYASSDLYYLKDIPCIDLRKSGTKTQNSPRLIPVLPQLQQVGFLEWAKRQKAKGRSLVESPTGVISVDAWSKRGNRYLRQVGYTDKALVLYSFRHTFRQVLRTSGLHPEIVNRIFGHETGEVGSGYGSNLSYEEAKLFMDKVKYPVFLDHLADRNGTFLW